MRFRVSVPCVPRNNPNGIVQLASIEVECDTPEDARMEMSKALTYFGEKSCEHMTVREIDATQGAEMKPDERDENESWPERRKKLRENLFAGPLAEHLAFELGRDEVQAMQSTDPDYIQSLVEAGERKRQRRQEIIQEVIDARAQLAAEASAVETSRIDEMLSKGVEVRFTPTYLGVRAEVLDARNGALLYAKTGATFAAALAALVQAEGTQPNSTESEVRE